MNGHYDLFTDNPTAQIAFLHDSGASVLAQAVDGRATLQLINLPDGNGATLTIDGVSYRGVVWLSRLNPNGSVTFAIDTFPFKSRRPAPRLQAPLPQFDTPDLDGTGRVVNEVHTTLPPEQVIPTRDVLFFKCDFTGLMLDGPRWGGSPPMLVGANSNFDRCMLMSPMLLLYDRYWQDAYLTEAAERGYTHFVMGQGAWNDKANGQSFTPQQLMQWASYIQSWGFYVVYWGPAQMNDPYLQTLTTAQVLDFHICGGEVDDKMTAEQYEAVLDNNLSIFDGPTGAHFTSNYPEGFPRDTFLTNWSKYNRKVHLCWQANQDETAGTQSARMYYARQRVNLGLVGGNGIGAPDSRVIAFEIMATNQLNPSGDPKKLCNEGYGNLRSWEALCATRTDPRIRPVSGCGNGVRYPNGQPL